MLGNGVCFVCLATVSVSRAWQRCLFRVLGNGVCFAAVCLHGARYALAHELAHIRGEDYAIRVGVGGASAFLAMAVG